MKTNTLSILSSFSLSGTSAIPGASGLQELSDASLLEFGADSAVVLHDFRMYGASRVLNLDVADGGFSSWSNAHDYVAPTAQVETFTATGSVTSAGMALVTFTSFVLGGATVLHVPVDAGMTAAQWRNAVLSALSLHPKISEHYSFASATGPERIIITKKLNEAGYANDPTLLLQVEDGSSEGIPTITSTNTTAGVRAAGILVDRSILPNASGAQDTNWNWSDYEPLGFILHTREASAILLSIDDGSEVRELELAGKANLQFIQAEGFAANTMSIDSQSGSTVTGKIAFVYKIN